MSQRLYSHSTAEKQKSITMEETGRHGIPPIFRLLMVLINLPGLPGLIIKISDQSGDYDFELVKSIPNSQLKGKMLAIENAGMKMLT